MSDADSKAKTAGGENGRIAAEADGERDES